MLSEGHKVPIKGFIETSFIDWKGHLSSVLFSGGCNFRCPYCHNSDLILKHKQLESIPFEHISARLKKFRKWVDHVVITGGEPTIHKGIFGLIEDIKSEDISVKLDTNGSNPSILKKLVNKGLIDYVAMDIKGPINRYKRWCGVEIDTKKIEESVQFILENIKEYEFRMTVVPFLHREEDVYNVAEYIKNAKRFYIQEFRPRNTLNPKFMSIKPFSPDKMIRIRENVSRCLSANNKASAV